MAMMIKEQIDKDFLSIVDGFNQHLDLSEAAGSSVIDPNSIMVEIEGIHAAPFATRNYTRYTPNCLKKSVASWTNPYRRPLIKHHNEEDGEIIGRICEAKYITKNTRSETPALLFTVNIPGEQAKADVKSGLLETTSIGVIAHSVKCSICGQELANGETCEHERGAIYNGETCYWDIHEMEAKELSYVIVPSDMYAKNIDIYPATASNSKVKAFAESLNQDLNLTKGDITDMPEDLKVKLQESEAKVTALTQEVTELKEAATQTSEKIAELEKTNSDLTTVKESLEQELEGLKTEKDDLTQKMTEAAQMREGLEAQVAEVKAELKEALVQNFVTMREALGHSDVDVEAVKNRSEESIKDSISDLSKDFKESLTKKDKDISNLGNTLQNPSLKESEDKKDVKEVETVDLKEQFYNIFSDILNTHK
jgi:protease/scaffold|nr:MAG TPA: SH3 domain protein [Caudoviricetes sp.]DAR70534.1 MAG TPA: SH3 domain protein [Caudoviricetes sp.]